MATDAAISHAGLNYNAACFSTLASDTADETFDNLRRSVEFVAAVSRRRWDDDFAAVGDTRFEQALR